MGKNKKQILAVFYAVLMMSDVMARSVAVSTSVSARDVPKFITDWWLNPADVEKISSFRSCAGHPYPWDVCANLKHYFFWKPNINTPKLFAPCNGTISEIRIEEMGVQIEIAPDTAPDYRVILFHIRPLDGEDFKIGQRLISGKQIGTQWTLNTASDLCVYDKNHQYLSGLYAMADSLLKQCDMLPDDFVISEKAREEWPCGCAGPYDQMTPAKGGLLDYTEINCHLFSRQSGNLSRQEKMMRQEQKHQQEKLPKHLSHSWHKGR